MKLTLIRYIFVLKIDEPLLEWFIDGMGHIIKYNSSNDDTIDIDSVHDTLQNLMNFDDVITEKHL